MTVVALWRYPVKSMAGERVDALTLGDRGADGDRGFAVVDRTTCRVASAKLPRRWGALLHCSAHRAADGTLSVTLPGGRVVTGPGPALDAAIGELTGADVTVTDAVPDGAAVDREWPDIDGLALRATETTGPIAGAAPGTFFDHAPVHLVTTAALALAGGDRGPADARRFRPNLVIAADPVAGGVPENAWVGRTIAVGDVHLAVTDPSPRCVVTAAAQPGLPRDLGPLQAVVRGNRVATPAAGGAVMPCLGVYAVVTRPGIVRAGDPVRVLDGR